LLEDIILFRWSGTQVAAFLLTCNHVTDDV
jgi:hypothetical protein